MHIYERTVGGRRYRVLATSTRVAGRQHPVSRQVSLGPVEDDTPIVPSQCREVGFRRVGDVGALLEVADDLGVLEAFDAVAPRTGEGPSLGEMILAVALQRVCEPAGKTHLPGFLADCIPRLSVVAPAKVTGQAFHRVTRKVEEAVYQRVQIAIAARACELYRLKTDVLAFDTTNFDTFLATPTPSKLAQRGHAKSKRADLRLVGLALMTSSTGSVPLFHRTYAGNESDKTVLTGALSALAQLHCELGGKDRTLVRDGGFAGEQLELAIGESGYHSVTVLPLSNIAAKEALAAAVGHLRRLPGKLHDIKAHRSRYAPDAEDRTLVVIESPELLAGQLRGMKAALLKARKELRRIQRRLEQQRAGTARGKRHTLASLNKRVAQLTDHEHLHEILHIVVGGSEAAPTLTFALDRPIWRRLIRERLGKRVLVTDQNEWTTSRIVRAFRSQWRVERAFRRMKRGAVSPWGPSYQWTDDSMRAHTFATVLGLQLATLVRLRLRRAGLRLSVRAALRKLAEIRLTRLLTHSGGMGGPRTIHVPPRLDAQGNACVRLFALDRWTSLISATLQKRSRPRPERSAR